MVCCRLRRPRIPTLLSIANMRLKLGEFLYAAILEHPLSTVSNVSLERGCRVPGRKGKRPWQSGACRAMPIRTPHAPPRARGRQCSKLLALSACFAPSSRVLTARSLRSA
jgi:hypothetical protein